jgi:hypothetical protein
VAAVVLGLVALPPAAIARSLRGSVGFSGFNGKFRGWNVFVFGTVGTAGERSDDFSISLSKARTRRVSESHEWSLNLPARTVRLNRSLASIAVNYGLGARGRISFRLSGRPHRAGSGCNRHSQLSGTLRGNIRVKVGGAFRTLRVRRLRGPAFDSGSGNCGGGGGVCGVSQTTLGSSGPSDATRRSLSFSATTQRVGRRPRQTFETFSVSDPTAGTPFSSIHHDLSANVKRSSFTTDATLLNAAVRAPGAPLSGRLTASGSGTPTTFTEKCGKRHERLINRDGMLTGGRVTARFSAGGKVAFDATTMGTSVFFDAFRPAA